MLASALAATNGNFTDTTVRDAINNTPLAQFKHLPARINLLAGGGGSKVSGSKRTGSDKITVKKARTVKK